MLHAATGLKRVFAVLTATAAVIAFASPATGGASKVAVRASAHIGAQSYQERPTSSARKCRNRGIEAKRSACRRGPAGPKGPKGLRGLHGLRGPVGPAGATGGQGAAGDDGADGTDGADGSDGSTGVTGTTGATGPTGVTGADATALWAVVASNGTKARGSASTTATTGTGLYTVTFAQSVVGCAYVATIGATGSGAPSAGGFAVTGGDSGSAFKVDVNTFAPDGTTAADKSFHLAVLC
jgi:hypothetical protein